MGQAGCFKNTQVFSITQPDPSSITDFRMPSGGNLSLETIILKLKFFYAISILIETENRDCPENVRAEYNNFHLWIKR
jgi:hypothetical protein